MGINLGEIIPRKEIDFADLKNKKVAIDAFNSLYQFLSSIRGLDGSPLKDSKGRVTSHLQGLFSRSLNLMAKGIKLVYVFDGEPPKLKSVEREGRAERKDIAYARYKEAVSEENIDAMSKYSRQAVRLDADAINESKEFVEALGLPCIQARSEADSQLAFMCKEGDVDYVATTDYDSILLGTPYLVRNLTLSHKRKVAGGKYVTTFLELIKLKDVLKELELDQDQLICLGILVGTDYNPGGIKGIGPKRALDLVRKYNKRFDQMFKDLNTDFDWKEIFDLFKNPSYSTNYKLKWQEINIDKIREILVNRHEFNEERVLSLIQKYEEESKENNQKGLNEFY